MLEITFTKYSSALEFLKLMKAGVLTRVPETDLFRWCANDDTLDSRQLELFHERSGLRDSWHDDETDLTWLLEGPSDYFPLPFGLEEINRRSYAGFNDWRYPTLKELKTLASSTADDFGVYVRAALSGKISGMYDSRTRYDAHDSAWWCFDRNRADKEDYKDGGIVWNSNGGFAGFEKSGPRNSARSIVVRGHPNFALSPWAALLVEWAESIGYHDFPASQRCIEDLESIEIPACATTIPPEIVNLKKLKSASVCAGSNLERALFKIPTLEHLCIRRYGNRKLETLDESIGNLQNLQTLTIDEFLEPKELPASIERLTKLRSLNLRMNKLERLPDAICSLMDLRELDVSFNNISALPESIGKLRKLEKLSAARNEIRNLPSSITELECLRELALSGSRIANLPADFGNLSKLQILFLADSHLADLPAGFERLENLTRLHLENNRFARPMHLTEKMPWVQDLVVDEKH